MQITLMGHLPELLIIKPVCKFRQDMTRVERKTDVSQMVFFPQT